MKEMMEVLWSEYFAEECAVISTKEEPDLIRKVNEIHKKLDESLTAEQCETMETYMEALYEMQGAFVKKAFFKGCDFAISFFLERGKYDKR